MKLNCDIVQDLLPLYEEDLCSPASRTAVEAHLRACPDCRGRAERARQIPVPQEPKPAAGEDRAAARSFRKVRRRWWASMAAVLLVVPVLLMTVNQVRGAGLCFTNLDEMATVAIYMNRLRSGQYEAAAGMLDYETMYGNIQEALSLSPQEHELTFVPVTLNGQVWYATEAFQADYLQTGTDDPWADLVYGQAPGILVPESEFQRVAALDPQSWELLDRFTALHTPWGIYYGENNGAPVEAADYCYHFELIPEAIYLEGKATLEADARKDHDSTWDYYGAAADMTLEEFTQVVRDDFIRRQEDVPQWSTAGLYGAYFVEDNDGSWTIQWTLKSEGGSFQVDFSVKNGLLRQVGAGAYHWEPEMDEIISSLDLQWPE